MRREEHFAGHCGLGLPFPGPGCGVFLFLGGGRSETRGSGMERMFHVGSVINSWLMTCTSVAPPMGPRACWNGVNVDSVPDPATRRGGALTD